ncbi:hypothetical protein OEZ86_009676 [Tetradesmus obliquus]|uniref:Response regulatory domain-containing protein n=1 Tax=Tetradesmus obliquus TaxID=3088 RepID=A0ABY8UP23_TETOB|nr:hypothetical protein OEZ85_001120 [Tetradesmus obliquus]WIA43164.1 hypothetical protein OEZ86_009676 [Tetradesmus obliquus]
MGIKRCPSFSERPGFPCGLRVLLVDGDTAARSHAEGLLKDCSYAVTPCSSTAEALALLNSGSSFDVLLADKDMLAGKACSSAGQQLLDMCQGVPCILMAANPAQEDIMTGIQLGAVDFLAKPLSPLKLQNIWQHTAMPPMAMAFGGFGNPAAAAAPGMMGGYSMPGSVSAFEAAAMQQQDAAAVAAAPVSCLPPQQQQSGAGGFTGASAAAALAASLGGSAAAADTAAAAATLDIGDAFDFMLGDITAEDDLDVNMIHSGLLDGELTALEREGLKLPADLAELQEQQQQQQRYQQQQAAQQRASMEAGSSRLSFDCHGRQRVSFDCSAASTTTGARVSFECSAASRGNIAGHQQRVSFEVNCNSAARGAAIAAAATAAAAAAAPQMAPPAFCVAQKQAAAAPSGKAAAAADPLLGSMSDLFAACSGDSCSEGSGGMTHVDSCGMLADLQSLFGPGGGCAGVTDDGCSGVAAAAAAAGLFDDVMDDLPLELSMKKSNSLAELLTTMQA